jgi:hypothetical protein
MSRYLKAQNEKKIRQIVFDCQKLDGTAVKTFRLATRPSL